MQHFFVQAQIQARGCYDENGKLIFFFAVQSLWRRRQGAKTITQKIEYIFA